MKRYMTADMDSGPERQRVFVELLDEGTPCLRPTVAESLGERRYRLLPSPDFDGEQERWAFPPYSIVRCRREKWSGEQILVARELAER